MTEMVVAKASKVDLEPTIDEIDDMAYFEARIENREFKDRSEWLDFCCMIENYIRRERGLV